VLLSSDSHNIAWEPTVNAPFDNKEVLFFLILKQELTKILLILQNMLIL
jgi:hypothetical protein